MNDEEKEYDLRQLRVMLRMTDFLHQKLSSLTGLLADLEVLAASLHQKSDRFRETLERHFNTLAEVDGMMKYEGRSKMTEFDRRLVEDALKGIGASVKTEMEVRCGV